MMNFGLGGRVVVVTGGASGIGRATAQALARDGARVGILDLQADLIESTVAELREMGAQAVGIALDVCDEAALESAGRVITTELGDVYGLVASAGIGGAHRAEDIPADDWTRIMNVNALGAYLCCRTFGKPMIERGAGSIVCIGSVDGLGAQAGRTAYCASKFAVNGLVKSLALEWGRFSVRVNCVAPTVVDTPLVRKAIPPYFLDVVADRTPMARIGRDDDIAGAVMMLLSDAAAYVTGVILPVDGGLTTGYLARRSGADLSSNRLLDAGIYTE